MEKDVMCEWVNETTKR